LPLRQAPLAFVEPAVQVRSFVPCTLWSIEYVWFEPSLVDFDTAVILYVVLVELTTLTSPLPVPIGRFVSLPISASVSQSV
jgi:hypothetical protein